MLRSLKDLEQYGVNATDGNVGSVVDFLLDSEGWIVRYLVVDTGPSFNGRRVLISPIFFRQAEWSTRCFHLALTMNKIKNGPSIDLDQSVSRRHEQDYYLYYGFPHYWGHSGLWGAGALPSSLTACERNDASAEHSSNIGDMHLRTAREVRGYHIQGSDEEIGHVEDFIVDDETWEVRYLVVDTSNWWFGKKVLVAPQWASRVNWDEGKVYVDMSREVIKNGPQWNTIAVIARDYESRLHDYYGRPVYWGSGDQLVAPPSI